ncbi:MAG TPA: hypothetical protein VMH81_40145 [Bryobacteraceae bacterium]|nr:hypothetical protein [Bryobacteraceae bacterium]
MSSATLQPQSPPQDELPAHNPWSVALALVLAVAGVFGLDALLFRNPIYTHYLEPESSTGLFEMILRREQKAQKELGDNLVVTLGNSRFAYSRKILDELPEKTAYVFRDAGVAGSNARVWYYMLRDLDPTAQRYRAVVIGVDDYDDEDRQFNPDDDIRELHYVIARLRLADTLEFARSFHSVRFQWAALRGGLLKGTIYQSDVEGFLSHPRKRIDYVHLCDRDWANWTYEYQETEQSMAGLTIDWATLRATLPSGADDNQRATVSSFLTHTPDPQTGRLAAYRREWLGKIVDRYRGSRTKVIFLMLPRGPVPRPAGLVVKKTSSIRDLAARPGVLLTGEHAFDALERPELFHDGMHLNRAGIARFSVMLSREIERVLGGPQSSARR